jgi:hypothetical protein
VVPSRRAVAGLVAAAGLAAGCTGGNGAAEPGLPSDSPTRPAAGSTSAAPTTPTGPGAALVVTTTDPPTDPNQRKVFADYVTFWQRDMVALTTNDLRRSGVLDYLIAPQAADTVSYVDGRRRTGVHSQGVLRIAPQVGTAGPRSATVRDCLDQTGMSDTDRVGRRTRLTPKVAMSVSLIRTPDGTPAGRWRVSRLTPTTDQLCR